ncbi:MAG: protein kinase, partial [Anaerolineales bacterium]|nr:protein kinase [Anaerolineales bacterium]
MADLTGFTVGGYEIRERVGAGGFGEVYRAFQPGVWRDVAVKVILPAFANNPEFIRRFEIEAQMIARLEHPHIVPLYDYWREPGHAYLVMRWLSGGNLHEKLRQEGPWSLSKTALLLRQVCSALAFAHRQNVIHRDLKPGNILLDEDGNAYLSDFGIAKLFDTATPATREGIIGTLYYSSPEQIRNEPVTPQSDIYNLGIVLYEMLVGVHPFLNTPEAGLVLKQLNTPLPAICRQRPELPTAIDEIVSQATAKNPVARFANTDAFLTAFYQAVDRALANEQSATTGSTRFPVIDVQEKAILTPPEPQNPYKGLRPFQEADTVDFFGREALVQRLLTRLQTGKMPAHSSPAKPVQPVAAPLPLPSAPGILSPSTLPQRFLALVGPSGSGKSSVIRAGLIPRLRQGMVPGSQNWFIAVISPGPYPWEELEAALLRLSVNPPPSLIEQLQQDERGLLRAIKRVLPPDEGELLLVIDQFEELFILPKTTESPTRFLNSLRLALEEPNSRLRLVITLRADFYDRPLLDPGFGELMRQGTEIILPMSAEELQRAICGPAERVGLTLEPTLVTTIIADVREQRGTLPLLQYALTELFEHRQDHLLTSAAYQTIGGVAGALTRRADELYDGLGKDAQTVTRQLFLRLITLGEGIEDTRRRVPRAELLELEGDPLITEAVIELFGRHRLLSFDRDPATRAPIMEIAHEALIKQWQQVRQWLDDSREDVRRQRMLEAAALEWERADKDADFLLRGARLSHFQDWVQSSDLVLTHSEMDFLQASLAAQAAREAVESARRARESALKRRSRHVLWVLVIVMFITTLGALLLASYAGIQQRQAERSAAVAQSFALAANSQALLLEDRTDLALTLALEANRLDDPPVESQLALSEAAYTRGGTRLVMEGHIPVPAMTTQQYARTSFSGVQSVAISPDSRLALSGADDHTLRL